MVLVTVSISPLFFRHSPGYVQALLVTSLTPSDHDDKLIYTCKEVSQCACGLKTRTRGDPQILSSNY